MLIRKSKPKGASGFGSMLSTRGERVAATQVSTQEVAPVQTEADILEKKYFDEWFSGTIWGQQGYTIESIQPLATAEFNYQVLGMWNSVKAQWIASAPEREQAKAIMANYGDEALELNILITALLRARDKFNEAAPLLSNPDAKVLVGKLSTAAQSLAEAVKKAGR